MISLDINNQELYNKTLEESNDEIIYKYLNIINEFIDVYINNKTKYKTKYYMKIIHTGINVIHNIFMITLLYSCNLYLVTYHVQKAFYLYIEFIEQINQEELSYLKFDVNDAVMFIYKRTIFDLHTSCDDKHNHKDRLEIIRSITSDINTIVYDVIVNLASEEKQTDNIYKKYQTFIDEMSLESNIFNQYKNQL